MKILRLLREYCSRGPALNALEQNRQAEAEFREAIRQRTAEPFRAVLSDVARRLQDAERGRVRGRAEHPD